MKYILKKQLALITAIFIFTALIPLTGAMSANAETTEEVQEDGLGYTVINIQVTSENTSEEIRTAIQNAFKTAKEEATADSPYKIVLPENTILPISSALVIYSNTYFDLNGSTILRDYSTNSCMLRIGKSTDINSSYDGYGNITVTNGTFDGWDNVSDPSVANLIRVGHARNVTFENLTLTDDTSSHYIELGACKDVTINNCNFANQYITEGDTTPHEAIQIDALNTTSFPLYYDYDGTACRDITITNCTFDNLTRGVGSHAVILDDTGYYYNIVITNNTFNDISDYAVNTLCWINSKINNNAFKDCTKGILFRTMRSDLARMYDGNLTSPITDCGSQIYSNTLSTTGDAIKLYGVNVPNDYKWKLSDGTSGTIPKGDYLLSNIKVSNNIISSTGTGIVIYHTAKSTISNNTITLSGSDDSKMGIYLTDNSYSNKITKNTVSCKTGKKSGAYLTNSKSNTINQNTVTGRFQSGISLNALSNSCTVTGNSLNSSKTYGIYTNNSKNSTITSNTMSSDKGSGIVLKESSTAKLIQSNTLSFTQRTCIVVENSTAQYIKSNTLTGGNNGIYTYLSTVNTISLNQCTDNSFGIYIKSSKADYINSNTISNEKNYGIRSTSSNIAHINSNTITNAKVYGIYSTNSQGQVMSNTVKSSGQYGMVFDSKATNQIYHNDFNNNTKGNILLQGKKSKVVSNISTPKTPEVKNTAYNKNKLSWEKIGSLKNYKVYRSTDNKSFTYIGLSKSNSFTDNKAITGVRYYYKICATNKASNAVLHSYYSSVKSGYTKGIAVVNNVVAKQKNSKKIQISWSTDISPESYIVYRSVNNSSFKQLATINGSLRKYIDTSISKGKTYTYKIKAISHNAKGKVISTALSKGAKITVTKSKN